MENLSTRDKLILAAMELFSKKGYSATSVDEIAASVGLKGPNLYKYFKGKEALLHELSAFSRNRYRENMSLDENSEICVHNGKQLKEFSLRQLRFTINDDYTRKLRRLFTIEQFKDEHISEQVTLHQFTNITTLFTKIMQGLIDEGAIDKDNDARKLAIMFVTPITIMIQICDREYDKKEEMMNEIESHIDFFIEKFLKN